MSAILCYLTCNNSVKYNRPIKKGVSEVLCVCVCVCDVLLFVLGVLLQFLVGA